MKKHKESIWKDYGYTWVTLGFFLLALIGHWTFGWFAYVDEQKGLHQPVSVDAYSILMMRDTMENWQSEFLQLIWQVAGLSFLLHIGSPASREGEDRMERKIDELLKMNPNGTEIVRKIDEAYAGRHTDTVDPIVSGRRAS